MATVYNKTTGERRVTDDATAKYLVLAGGWSWTPVSVVSATPSETGGTDAFGKPILPGTSEVSQPGNQELGANLTYTTIVGLYNDGVLSYEAAAQAMAKSGLNANEIVAILAGAGPEEEEATFEVWQDVIAAQLVDGLSAAAKEAGFLDPKSFAEGFLQFHWDGLMGQLNNHYSRLGQQGMNNPSIISSMINDSLSYLQGKWQWGDLPKRGASSGLGGGGGGGGRNVRDLFDVDALSGRITDMWQTFLISEPANAKALANDYINLVAGSPDRTIDFETWVKNRMKEDPRWNFVFQNKPKGISEESYIRYYAGQVMNVLGPTGDAPGIARSQAALAAGPDAIAGRLKFHQGVTQTSGYLNRVEEKYRSVRDVLGAF